MRASIRLGKVAGIEVGVHYSWFFVLALFVWFLGRTVLPDAYPTWSEATYWVAGTVAALLLFASVLVHEFAHSLVAKARGFPVQGITLFLLGGVSNVRADSRDAGDEFVISVVGPLTSFLLFGLLLAASLGMSDESAPITAVVSYLAWANLALGVFNLLPAFPLDGGRVFRSTIWAITGNFTQATRVASWGGQLLGFVLMGVAAWVVVALDNILGGLWIGLIGWFLQASASASRRELKPAEDLGKVLVADAMERDPQRVSPETTISRLVQDHLLKAGARAALVCEGDRLVGIITLSDLMELPRDRWDVVTVGERMTRAPLKSVAPHADLVEASQTLADLSLNQAPVLEGDRAVGMLTRAHVIRHLHGLGNRDSTQESPRVE